MSVADAPWVKPASIRLAARQRIFSILLASALCAFTLTTQDGGEIPSRIISAIILAITGCYLLIPPRLPLKIGFPAGCLLLMVCYGIGQTLWSSQRIVYNGCSGVLFWLTAAAIALLASQVFQDREQAFLFQLIFVLFGSALCVLDLLEQASKTNRYFWIVPSRYEAVYGSFAYWNNFAQFVELLLPVTLWLGLGRKKPDLKYLLLAAVQVGAAAASGSRAGSALVLGELVVLLLLAYRQNRNQTFLYAATATIVFSAGFVYSAGVSQVMQKLHQADQLSVRRDINRSSLAMIEQRPLTGWGLETYATVYPMFARYDAGTYVNQAHNDWLEWTAEGGIFFSGLMLTVFVWTLRPAVRSLWGIGCIAVCLHAAVDYPFARFGVCGWYFALLGMLVAWQSKDGMVKRLQRR